MSRTYAGILGSLAFITMLARGLSSGGGFEASTGAALVAMLLLAALGYVVGAVANWIVEDSVRSRVAAEVAAATQTQSTNKSTES